MKFLRAILLGLCLCIKGFAEYDSEECCENWWDKPLWTTVDCDYPVWGEWLPEEPILMRPFIADPRELTFGAGWRFNDECLVKNVIPVSYDDHAILYRWYNLWPWCGILDIQIDGALWAVFDPLHDSSPLMNADYYGGFAITYGIDNWEFRLRGFHISSHIGDEFLLNHPHFRRKNPSAQYLDFFVSHDFDGGIRAYAGLGWIVGADESFKVHRFYADAGAEIRFYDFGFYSECGRIYGTPFFALFLRHRGENRHHVDMTYALGYEVGKTYGLERRLRLYLEYHDGYSVEGQHAKCATSYLSLRLSYGF